jgi:hypothetical protein
MRGQLQHAVSRNGSGEVAPGSQCDLQGVGGLVVGHNDDHWHIGGTRKEGNVEGAGGRSESGDTTTPTGKGEVPPCLFK